MSFTRPDLLILALLLPALIALAVAGYARRRARVARGLGDPDLIGRLGGGDLARFPIRRLVLLCTAAAALGITAAGPRWGRGARDDERASALNVVLALDISRSMFAADLEPNRLERERLFARRLLRELAGNRLGMVVFAGRAYVLSPLTVDHSALNLYLDALDPEIVSQGGSSIAAAITQATDLARGSEEVGGDRAVILMTDGEALEDVAAVRDAAERAARANVSVVTIGIGTAAGSPIPEVDTRTGRIAGYKRDPGSGEVVVSKLDEALLREVAELSGGAYVALDRAGSVDAVVEALRGLERTEVQGGRALERPERFAIFIAIALLLIALDAVWPRLAAARARLAMSPTPPGAAAQRNGFARGSFGRAAMALALLASLGFGIGDVERGNRHYRAGRFAEAAAAYEAAIRDGNASPEVRYNLGTALLQLGRYAEAEEQLRQALEAVEPELRQRAYYNLGNRFLGAARSSAEPQNQQQLLDAAVEAYKRALRLDPSDVDAKWNLEMALREQEERPQPPPQSGEGEQQQDQDQGEQQQQSGGGSGGADRSEQEGPRDPGSAARNEMSRDQADRILSAVEQDERDLTRERLRKGQRRTPVTRDW
jgi:Ca-activated chloride channel family protein